jgi:hypothetical protein
MTQTHPITPPPELRRQWLDNDHFPMVTGTHDLLSITRDRLNSVIDQAAQWGADQELEACCEWLAYEGHEHEHLALRAARRPEPPSLKEQALEALQFVDKKLDLPLHNHCNAIHTIRRALEALDD